MAWAFVQSTIAVPASGTASSIVGIQFGANVTAGNTIIVAACRSGTTAGSTITDSLGNTFIVRKEINDATNGDSMCVGDAVNAIGGASSITVHFPTGGFRAIVAHEYSGIGAFDVTAGQAGVSSAANSTIATTTGTGDLIFGAIHNDGGTSTNASSGAGFTRRTFQQYTAGAAYAMASEDKNQAAAGSTRAQFNQNAADGYICIMTTYSPSGGGGGDVANWWGLSLMGIQ